MRDRKLAWFAAWVRGGGRLGSWAPVCGVLVALAGCGGGTTLESAVCTPACPVGTRCTLAGCELEGGPVDFASAAEQDLSRSCQPACGGATPYCNDALLCVPCTRDEHCPTGQVCKLLGATSACAPGCGDDARCGGGAMRCCDGQCVDGASDPAHCGECANACAASNAAATCVGGQCGVGACAAGWGDCNQGAEDGCEANLRLDTANCGACGATCKFKNATAACASGCYIAACDFGWDECNGKPEDGCEVSVLSDARNCGGCGMSCDARPNATMGCSNAACRIASCTLGFLDCDKSPANGCEVNGGNDNKNCGACGNACPMGLVCKGSQCTCPQCMIPNASAKCINNVCLLDKCNLGFGDCDGSEQNGCEAPLTADDKNCGACNNVCPQNTPFCFDGVCSAYVPPMECQTAQKIDDAGRNMKNQNGVICDSNMGNTWYQFVNATGTKMPEQAPAEQHCSTHAPGWISKDGHPKFGDGKVKRNVCFNWAGNQCQWNIDINVINCGNYYVYQLPNTPVCNLRYCGTD